MSIHSVKDGQANVSFRVPGNEKKPCLEYLKKCHRLCIEFPSVYLETNYETLETLCSLQRHKEKQGSKFKRVSFVTGILMPGVPHAMAPEEGLVYISPLFSA